jgi:hypothetical protein
MQVSALAWHSVSAIMLHVLMHFAVVGSQVQRDPAASQAPSTPMFEHGPWQVFAAASHVQPSAGSRVQELASVPVQVFGVHCPCFKFHWQFGSAEQAAMFVPWAAEHERTQTLLVKS